MSTTKKYRITHNSEIMITQICQLKKNARLILHGYTHQWIIILIKVLKVTYKRDMQMKLKVKMQG